MRPSARARYSHLGIGQGIRPPSRRRSPAPARSSRSTRPDFAPAKPEPPPGCGKGRSTASRERPPRSAGGASTCQQSSLTKYRLSPSSGQPSSPTTVRTQSTSVARGIPGIQQRRAHHRVDRRGFGEHPVFRQGGQHLRNQRGAAARHVEDEARGRHPGLCRQPLPALFDAWFGGGRAAPRGRASPGRWCRRRKTR